MTTTLSGPPVVSARNLLAPEQVRPALLESLRKLDPRTQVHQPVIFVVWVGSVFSTVLAIADSTLFGWLIAAWLWLTVLFANFAEAVAEGRGKAQAAALRNARTHRGRPPDRRPRACPPPTLRPGDRSWSSGRPGHPR